MLFMLVPDCLHLLVDLHTPTSSEAQSALCKEFESQELSFLSIFTCEDV